MSTQKEIASLVMANKVARGGKIDVLAHAGICDGNRVRVGSDGIGFLQWLN